MLQRAELRPLQGEDEKDEWLSHVHYAFAPHRSGEEVRELQERRPEPEMLEKKGYFVDGAMVSICGLIDFTGRLRGTWVPIGGIGPVATPPEHRRRGYAKGMLRDLLVQMRDRGIYTSALWPFYSRFYECLGWGVSAESSGFKFSTEDLRRLVRGFGPQGTFSRASEEDIEVLDRIYRCWAQDYDLTIKREQQWWKWNVLTGWETRSPYIYLYRNSHGDASAYVVYLIRGAEDNGRTMHVMDYAYADLDSYSALLKFLLDHDSQVGTFRIDTPANDPLFDWQATGEVKRHRGIMFRVVDVCSALEAVPFPRDLRDSAVLEVSDSLCGWNEGKFSVAVSGGRAEVCPTDDAPDVQLDIRELSQLYAGYRSPEQLQKNDGLRVHSVDGLDLLGRLFPQRETYMAEDF